MPCYTEPPSQREEEERRLNLLLDEVGEKTPRQHGGNIYGAMRNLALDDMTAKLCEWCLTHDVKAESLELQIWWRDHQRWDAKRKADEERAAERERLKATAKAKLTAAERKALGID